MLYVAECKCGVSVSLSGPAEGVEAAVRAIRRDHKGEGCHLIESKPKLEDRSDDNDGREG